MAVSEGWNTVAVAAMHNDMGASSLIGKVYDQEKFKENISMVSMGGGGEDGGARQGSGYKGI